jgi:hypothetical protein
MLHIEVGQRIGQWQHGQRNDTPWETVACEIEAVVRISGPLVGQKARTNN